MFTVSWFAQMRLQQKGEKLKPRRTSLSTRPEVSYIKYVMHQNIQKIILSLMVTLNKYSPLQTLLIILL